MVSSDSTSRATFGANDHGNSRVTAKHIAVLTALVGNLIHRQRREIHIHDLRHRAHPRHGCPDSRAANRGFRNWSIQNAPLAKFFEQAAGSTISAAIQTDIFPKQENPWIAQHLFPLSL